MTIEHFQVFNQCNALCSFQSSSFHLLPCLDIGYNSIQASLHVWKKMQVCRCTGNYLQSFQIKVTSYLLQLLHVTYVAAAGRSPSYVQPLCGCIQSNSALPLNVLCRADRQTDRQTQP